MQTNQTTQPLVRRDVELKDFENSRLSFRHDSRYILRDTPDTGQVFLENDVSNIILTDPREALDIGETLTNLVDVLMVNYAEKGYQDIKRTDIAEREFGNAKGKGFVFSYINEGINVESETMVVSNGTNTFIVYHIFPLNMKSMAHELFNPMKGSFAAE